MIYFKLFYAPANATFTNGLMSQINPSTFTRLKVIFLFYLFELKSPKWNGLLLVTLATLLLNFRTIINKKDILLTIFLFSIITFYYFVNT